MQVEEQAGNTAAQQLKRSHAGSVVEQAQCHRIPARIPSPMQNPVAGQPTNQLVGWVSRRGASTEENVSAVLRLRVDHDMGRPSPMTGWGGPAQQEHDSADPYHSSPYHSSPYDRA